MGLFPYFTDEEDNTLDLEEPVGEIEDPEDSLPWFPTQRRHP